MRLVIAEKPSLGRAIAEALPGKFEPVRMGSGKDSQTVALRSDAVVVTWAFGHILEMAPPEEYDPKFKRWRVEDLPILVKEWKLVEKVPAQIKAIGSLLKKCSECVNAGDPDREGQLLIDEILHHLGWKGKTLRMLPHATDPDSIRKAWSRLEPNDKYRPLYQAALCRQRADWLVGMTASRAATLLLTQENQLVPVGRVMTPTLALVVRRDREIEAFESKTFWKVVAVCKTRDGKSLELVHDPDPHLFDQAKAQSIAEGIRGKIFNASVRREKGREKAPLPWHLGDFQRAMQKMLGLSLQDSLQVLQSLYEKQLASYPRTDCRYLPEEQRDDAIPILDRILDAALGSQGDGDSEAQRVRALRSAWEPKGYIYNNAKVAEHHGIVPTRKTPAEGQLDRRELTAWRAIVRHFARTLLPHHEFEETAITITQGDAIFALKGKRSLNWERSWRVLDERKDAVLPELEDGQQVKVVDVRLEQGKTTPPERYTEATLSADMEAIAKYVTDERIKSKLKETSGIGTAATRPAIVEKLKQKGMLSLRQKGKVAELISTPFGREVVDAMPGTLTDPSLTAAWEEALDQIARSEYQPEMFMDRVESMVGRLVDRMKAGGSRIRSLPDQPKKSESRRTAGARSSSKGTARTGAHARQGGATRRSSASSRGDRK